MANLEELVVSLVAETSGLRAELSNATKATKDATSKMETAIEEFSKNSSKQMGVFETAMATAMGFLGSQAVQAALGMVKDGLSLIGEELMKGADSAIAEEQAMKRLANSLAISGKYSVDAMKGLQDFTSEMERNTGVADDVVAANLAVLSSLTRLDAEGLKSAQKAALDFSAATGKDLESATMMVAKAVNGSTDAFKKMGITIAESTDKTTALRNTVAALNGQFGGAAAGAVATFQGSVTKLTNSWGNLTESLATAVTKNPVVIAMLQQISTIIDGLTGASDNASVALQQGLGKALLSITMAVAQVAATVDAWLRVFAAGLDTLILPLNALAGAIGWVGDKLGIVEDKDPFSRLKETYSALEENITGSSTLGTLADNLLQVHDAGVMAFGDITSASAAVKPTLDNQKAAVNELSAAYQQLVDAYATSLAEQGMALDNHFAYENEARALQTETELAQITDNNALKYSIMEEDFALRQEALAAQQQLEWDQLAQSNLAKSGNNAQYEAAKTALSQKQYLENKKMSTEHTKFEADQLKQREANQASTFQTIATLSSSSNKELAAIGKAAAITTATMDGIVAVQKALSAFPPPFNFVAAALVGVAAAANVAKIAGVSLNKGGTLSGGGANVDTVPANLTKGETVITRGLTNKLGEFLDEGGGGGGGGPVTIEIRLKDSLIEFIEAKIVERQNINVSLLGTT